MEIHSSVNSVGSRYLDSSTMTPKTYEAGKKASFTENKNTNVINDKQAQASSTVSISGRALMIAKLFGSGAKEPPVLPSVRTNGDYLGVSPQHFLTHEDRNLLADMYELAQEQGADLKYVSMLAGDLGSYRQHDNGSMMGNFNDGHQYDSEGRLTTVSFTDADAATAERIQNSDAISSTRIDKGFLSYILDPGYSIGRSSNFEFLEQMVSRFSTNDNDTSPLDPKFSTFAYNENKYIMHTADEVTLNIPRDTSSAEEDTSREALMADAKDLPQRLNLSLLEAFIGKNDEKPSERSFLTKLFDWLKPSANK
ncbi:MULTISPECIES: hypothetical protein [unclassified Halomonas]|uniref:hypothetical protein n=1 Tax=unclassified Halomonas TaxID=2609666 RepID=UPI000AACBD41|nr:MULTISPECIES: hypothetical protein [unclassified Halomonas]MBT2788944.1 hypothetical protein [Halomonas sp. ISL-106]MBT2799127.1 hypothetical protein [Halomonas sp. ISL-104]